MTRFPIERRGYKYKAHNIRHSLNSDKTVVNKYAWVATNLEELVDNIKHHPPVRIATYLQGEGECFVAEDGTTNSFCVLAWGELVPYTPHELLDFLNSQVYWNCHDGARQVTHIDKVTVRAWRPPLVDIRDSKQECWTVNWKDTIFLAHLDETVFGKLNSE